MALKFCFQLVEFISVSIGKLVRWLIFFMMLLIGYDVFSRYVLNKPLLFSDELSAYMLVSICFLGAAGTLKENGHIVVDIIVTRLPSKAQFWLKLTTLGISLIFISVLCWHVVVLVYNSYTRGVTMPSILLTPLWIPQTAMLVGIILLILQLIVEIAKHLMSLREC